MPKIFFSDFNNDGMKDIVIGSPTAGTTDLGYRGCLTYLSGNIGSYQFWGNFCPQYGTNHLLI